MVRVCWPMFVLLWFGFYAVAVERPNSKDSLKSRKRREWIFPARNLKENTDFSHLKYIAKIRSDFDSEDNILYSLEGIGANQYPFHVFVVDHRTGFIRVTTKLDREFIDMYNLLGVATYSNGTLAEKNIDIRIKVVDENDNPPVFGSIPPAEVDELSPIGTTVVKIFATDADEPGNQNSQIAYSLIDQKPPHDMFIINTDGTICVKKPILDRETQDQYILTVKGQDLNGNPEGHTGTGTVTINVRDVNDNPPTLEKSVYNSRIVENTQGVELMRLKTQDLDLKEAEFDIIRGNETGYFSVKTDPATNEGKSVDYEDLKNLELGIAVGNKAPPYDPSLANNEADINFGGGGGGGGANGASGASGASGGSSHYSYPIKINRKNHPEGPRFDPKVKAFPISEGGHMFNMKDVIGSYPAVDGDTGKPAENVRYAKGSDPDNWLLIDPKTAEIRLNKMPDRQSKFLVNGTYTAKVICVTDEMPAKTATGTIAIQVEDFNDNCPTLTSNFQTMCTTDDTVIVNVVDEDSYPNVPLFQFAIVPEGTKGKWQVEQFNDTGAILRAQEPLWPGVYEVEFVVTDEQGEACPEPQKVKVEVYTCELGIIWEKRGTLGQATKKSELGPAGIGMLLLGLLLLLLTPLLVFFFICRDVDALKNDFTEMPFDTQSHHISYNTEGQGENTEVPLLTVPTQIDWYPLKQGMRMNNNTLAAVQSVRFRDGMNGVQHKGEYARWDKAQRSTKQWNQYTSNGFYNGTKFSREARVGDGGLFDDIALPENILAEYYAQKVTSGLEPLNDAVSVYDYEGQNSPVGSVGCCSLVESDNDLQFLDDLGPMFKTLAEVCGGKANPTEVKQVSTSLPIGNTQTSVSSFVSAPQLPPPPKLQQSVTKTEQTVVKETSEHSQVVNKGTAITKGGITTVKQGMGNQGQKIFLQQQPVYYTTSPMLQPMYYVVQPEDKVPAASVKMVRWSQTTVVEEGPRQGGGAFRISESCGGWKSNKQLRAAGTGSRRCVPEGWHIWL